MPLTLLVTATSWQTMADQNIKYVFKATDNSNATQLCVASANNDLVKVKKLVIRDKFGVRDITRNLTCNGENVTGFSAKYNAQVTAEYLNRHAPKQYKMDLDNVTITDLAYTPALPQTVKVIYVSSK